MVKVTPFLRWAGGKAWLTEYIQTLIEGLEFKNYYEPFLGGAAVYFSLNLSKKVYLSDVNDELINAYISVRDSPTELAEIIEGYIPSSDEYYRIRALEPQDNIERAARFIYLNHTSYNGLYRVNRAGKYNVPYGKITTPYDVKQLFPVSEKLQGVSLSCEDFAARKEKIKRGDLIFLDPPYSVSQKPNENGFIAYNQTLFSLNEQYRLSEYIDVIKKKGAYYILTNSAHELIRGIFDKGDRIITLQRNSLIGGKNSMRGKVSEYLFTNIPDVEVENV